MLLTEKNQIQQKNQDIKDRQIYSTVAEYIISRDRKVLIQYFESLPEWFEKIENTGLEIQDLKDFLRIILNKETGIREHFETKCKTNSKQLRENFRPIMKSIERFDSFKYAKRAFADLYRTEDYYKNTDVEIVILAWCFENSDIVKPYFDAYMNKFRNIESIHNAMMIDPKFEILRPLLKDLKPVFLANEKLFLNYEAKYEFERFLRGFNDELLAFTYCQLQETLLTQAIFDDYGIGKIMSKYENGYGELWMPKYALSLLRHYAKDVDLNFEIIEYVLSIT